MMKTPLQVYEVALVICNLTLDVTEVDARSTEEALDLARTVFNESGFKCLQDDMEIISIESAISVAVREFLDKTNNPFKQLNKGLAYSVLVEYVEGLLTWEHPETILAQVLESDEEIQYLTYRIIRINQQTVRVCSRCGTPVEVEKEILSYPYYCPECDENLFGIETSLMPKTQREGVARGRKADGKPDQPCAREGEQLYDQDRDVSFHFAEYEAEGYSQKFWTPYTDYKSRIGETFKVVRRIGDNEVDAECLPIWKIKFKDGFEISAFPEEIIPSAILANGGQI